MVLLRASSQAVGETPALEGANGEGDGGLPHGEALLRFAEAATRNSEDLEEARRHALEAVGPAGFIEAAATIGIFNGLVRVADATGIPLDDGTRNSSKTFRAELGFDAFAGAANSDLAAATGGGEAEQSVQRLFS